MFYHEAIRLHPRYAKAYDNLGAIYDDGSADGAAKAEEMYSVAMELNPHHPSAYCNLAGLFTLQERFTDAVKTLLKVQNYDSHYYTATIKLAKLMHKRGFDRDAELLFQHILLLFKLDNVPIAEPYNHYGNLLTELKRYEEAMQLFEQAILLDPTNPDPKVNLAWVKHTLGAVTQADQLYNEALQLRVSVPALMRLGSLRFKQGRSREAEELYERARLMDPKNPQIPVEQSVVLQQMGRAWDAVKILESAREIDTRCAHPDIYINLAKLYGHNLKRHVQAASILEICNHHAYDQELEDDRVAEIKYHLGAVYDEIAKKHRGIAAADPDEEPPDKRAIRKAKTVLREAIELKPGDADYRVLLAQIHLRTGELEIGLNILTRALKINSNHEVALILQEKVRKKQSEMNSKKS